MRVPSFRRCSLDAVWSRFLSFFFFFFFPHAGKRLLSVLPRQYGGPPATPATPLPYFSPTTAPYLHTFPRNTQPWLLAAFDALAGTPAAGACLGDNCRPIIPTQLKHKRPNQCYGFVALCESGEGYSSATPPNQCIRTAFQARSQGAVRARVLFIHGASDGSFTCYTMHPCS